MNTLLRSALVATLAAAATFPALADVPRSAVQSISPGKDQAAVEAALGKPESRMRDLITDSSGWLYRETGGTLGNEPIWRINFDTRGQVTSVERHDAAFYDMRRYH